MVSGDQAPVRLRLYGSASSSSTGTSSSTGFKDEVLLCRVRRCAFIAAKERSPLRVFRIPAGAQLPALGSGRLTSFARAAFAGATFEGALLAALCAALAALCAALAAGAAFEGVTFEGALLVALGAALAVTPRDGPAWTHEHVHLTHGRTGEGN